MKKGGKKQWQKGVYIYKHALCVILILEIMQQG